MSENQIKAQALRDAADVIEPDWWEQDGGFTEGKIWAVRYLRFTASQLEDE